MGRLARWGELVRFGYLLYIVATFGTRHRNLGLIQQEDGTMQLAAISRSTMTLEELEQELLQLPPEVRSHLAEVLAQSVRQHYADVWDEEAERRYQAYLRGELEAIPAEEVLAEVRAKLVK
jgi:Putative addiction module component